MDFPHSYCLLFELLSERGAQLINKKKFMAPKKRTPKRLHANVDSDSDRRKTNNSFPGFIGLKSLEEIPLTKTVTICDRKGVIIANLSKDR